MRNSNIPLYKGKVIYLAAHHDSKIRKVTLSADLGPFDYKWTDEANEYIRYEERGYTHKDALGDRGFGKFAYDSRPSAIHLTKFQAKKALKRGNKWWDKQQADFNSWSY